MLYVVQPRPRRKEEFLYSNGRGADRAQTSPCPYLLSLPLITANTRETRNNPRKFAPCLSPENGINEGARRPALIAKLIVLRFLRSVMRLRHYIIKYHKIAWCAFSLNWYKSIPLAGGSLRECDPDDINHCHSVVRCDARASPRDPHTRTRLRSTQSIATIALYVALPLICAGRRKENLPRDERCVHAC